MENPIEAKEYQLRKIFCSDFECHIPAYQRPYSWTIGQVSELFDDLYSSFQESSDEYYFLGSIVLIKSKTDADAAVVDGQQRLTTLTILFATLAYTLNKKTETQSDEEAKKYIAEAAKETKEYIIEPGAIIADLKEKPRLILRERDREFFQKHVQNLHFDELLNSPKIDNESQKNIQGNSKYFLGKINEKFGENTEELIKFMQFLVKQCCLVVVSTPNEKSAFRVFSVMNSRGLNLQTTDILKADIIGKLPKEEQDEYTQKWEEMEVELERDGFNNLFSYIRMIYAKKKPKKPLLEEFKEYVIAEFVNKEAAFLDDTLEPYSNALSIVQKEKYKATSDAEKINYYLRWLNRIDNSDWRPVAILFIKQKHEPEYVEWFFRKLERLAAFMHICSKNINKRIERYSIIIEALEKNNHNLETPISEIELSPEEKEELKKNLGADIYDFTPSRKKYVVLRLNSFMEDRETAYNPVNFTIEHVLPQTINEGSDWAKHWPDSEQREYWKHKIANLVPLNKKRNAKAQNFDFEKKKNAYFAGTENITTYALTVQVLNSTSWTKQDLEKRQEELLGVMYKNWELN